MSGSPAPVVPAPVVVVLPLDERPATGGLARLVGAVAGAHVLTPPRELMPRFRSPGDTSGLAVWLSDACQQADLAVVSLELLAFGGLVPSRIGAESAYDALRRWEVLRTLSVPVHASCVVLRTPDADDASEEPSYYARQGRAVHAASAALATGQPVPPDTDRGVLRDFLGRRLRNHAVNLAAMGLVLDGAVQTLATGADDTAVAAVGSVEQDWLRRWSSWLDLGERLVTYPGADEMAAVLLVRGLAAHSGGLPATVRTSAADVAGAGPGLTRVAPYENVPVGRTASGQVRAAGAVEAGPGGPADLELVVHPPSAGPGDFAVAPPASTDERAARATAQLVARLLEHGARVAVADCAYPNGADPALVTALHEVLGGRWERLAGFAGWNTAGNSIGTAVAHGLAVVAGERSGTLDHEAHASLLRHRLLEDWGWMSSARAVVRERLGSDPRRHDTVPDDGSAERLAAELLTERLVELGSGWDLAHVGFPWHRTFEVDLAVRPA